MPEGDQSRAGTSAEERTERITEAIALASLEAFDDAISHLQFQAPDDLGVIEEALRMFLGDLRDAKQEVTLAIGELTDAKAELERKLATIERQELAIRELSTPILELWDGILSLPVIGVLDTARALVMTEKLLRQVLEAQAKWVLVDLTGVAEVDAATADHLIRLAGALRLIGCRCILTGIGPHVADTLAGLHEGLHDLRPLRSLRDGLRYCLTERSKGHG
jgi:rsbT co-antagonist protein RsbR